MSWKDYFENKIWSRGKEYYINNHVFDFQQSANGMSARVAGSESYRVEIRLTPDKKEIQEMRCTCPYAAQDNCKHMAAVLCKYLYDENEELETVVRATDSEVESFILQADERQLRSALIELVKMDSGLLIQLKQKMNISVSSKEVQGLRLQLAMIFSEYEDSEGFIDYYAGDGLVNDLSDFFLEYVDPMVENGDYHSVFLFSTDVLSLLSDTEMDGSSGEHDWIAENHGVVYWREIAKFADEKVQNELFEWLMKQLSCHLLEDFLEDYLQTVLFESFQSQEQLQRKLHFVDQMIQEISEGTSEGWWKDYQLKKWLPYKMQVLVDLDESNERLRFFFEQHQQIVDVRSRYIDELISRKEYHEAIKCLEDSVKSKEIPDETRWKYQWLLKDLYRKMDNRQAYQKMLWTLVQQMSKFDFHLELYNELKSQYTPEEWLDQREQLIQSWEKSHGDLNRIYKLEGLYDRLMKNLLENGTIYDLAAYEDILKKDYSPQLLERYQTLVEEMAVPVTNRRTYQQIASLLRRMKKFKGGTLKVHGLVLDLQEKYKRRRAMVEELGKVLS